MRITPGFAVAAVVCTAPFALAVRDDLSKREEKAGDFSSWQATHREPPPDLDLPTAEEPPASGGKQPLGAGDLRLLVGTEPASLGPLFIGIELGTTGTVPSEVLDRIEAAKTTRYVNVEYDQDDAALHGLTIRALGAGSQLRDALIALWGTPRRLAEDELIWLGPSGTRAELRTMVDGIDLTFTPYLTIDALLAPDGKSLLGNESFKLVGAKLVDVETQIGWGLQQTSYDDEWSWTLPGVGVGTGRTTVRITVDAATTKVTEVEIVGSTIEAAAIRDALTARWGAPKPVTDDDGLDALSWKRGGVTTLAYIDDDGFMIRQRK